jgi:hypothetical protein
MTKNVLLVLVLAVVVAGGAFAQEAEQGAAPQAAASKLAINAGLAIGNAGETVTSSAMGGLLSVDYRLSAVSVGGELGILNCGEAKAGAIPILAKVAYHFGNNPKMDIALVGKIGFAFGTGDGLKEASGVAYGFDLDFAYYFTPKFGIFAEGGFDRYALAGTMKTEFLGTTISIDYEMPFTKFLTLGVGFKL